MQISRRGALMGATAAAAVVVAGVPVAGAASDPVVGLVEQLRAAWQAWMAADDVYEEAAHEKGFNPLADHPVAHVKTADGGEYLWSPAEIQHAATDGRRYGALTQEEADHHIAEAEAHQHEADRLRRERGLDPFKENVESWKGRYWQLQVEVLETPALTVAGVLAKMRGFYHDGEIAEIRAGGDPTDSLGQEWAASIYRDLEHLAGGMQS